MVSTIPLIREYINTVAKKLIPQDSKESELINHLTRLSFRSCNVVYGNYNKIFFLDNYFEVILKKQVFNDKKLLNIKKIGVFFTDTNTINEKYYGPCYNMETGLNLLILQLLLCCKWKNRELQKHLINMILLFNLIELKCIDLYSLYRAGNENLSYLKIKKTVKISDFKTLVTRYSKLYSIIYKLGFSLKKLSLEFNSISGDGLFGYEADKNIFIFIQNIMYRCIFKYKLIFENLQGRIDLLRKIFDQWKNFKNGLYNPDKFITYIINDFEFVAFILSVNLLPEDKLIWFINKVRFGQTWHTDRNDNVYSCFLVASKFYNELQYISSFFLTYENNVRLVSLVKKFGIELINKSISIIQILYNGIGEDRMLLFLERTANLLKFNFPEKIIMLLTTEINIIYYLEVGESLKMLKEKHKRLPNNNEILLELIRLLNNRDMEINRYIVNNFNYKSILEVMNSNEQVFKDLDLSYKLKLVCLFWNKWKNIKQQIIKAANKNMEKPASRMHSFLASLDNTPFFSSDLREWLSNNAGANKDFISSICFVWNLESFPRNGTRIEMKQWIVKHNGLSEYIECQKKWPNLNWRNFPCELPLTKTTFVEVLNPNDERMVMVGIITHCCQRRDGIAESCMVASLTHPRSSNLVFYHEKHKNKIIAFAWIWDFECKGERILVLDNIELADQRQIDCILLSLREWCEASPYKNIQLGTRCSDISTKRFPGVETEYMGMLSGYRGYTDARIRVWLKKNGELFI